MSGPHRQWLEILATTPRAYEALLAREGSIALAAHRLATAKCACYPIAASAPSARELLAAAREISSRIPGFDTIPTARALADECVYAGLLVVGR